MMNGRMLREKGGKSEERKGRQGEKKGRIWSQLTSGGIRFESGPNDCKARAFSFMTQPSNISMSEKQKQACVIITATASTVCAQLLSCVQLFATPWTEAHQSPLSMEFSRQEYWSGVPLPTPGGLPYPGIDPCLLCLLHWRVGSSPLYLLGSPPPVSPEPIHVPGLCRLSFPLYRWGTSFSSLSVGEDQ